MAKSELEELMTSVTPQSLKDNDSISKLIELYFSNLSSQQEISQDPIKLLDTDFLIQQSENAPVGTSTAGFDQAKSELFKIHLNEIYNIFEQVQDSDKIYKKYKEIYTTLNLPTDKLKIDFNLDKEINDEYITASNSFKTKKGTKAGFFFVNDIINKVNIDPMNADKFFEIEEGLDGDTTVPYSYTVKASLYKEVFKETVLPLSHPVGFDWHFLRLLYLTLVDHFGLIETKTMTDLSLTCYKLENTTGTSSDIQKDIILESTTDIDGKTTVNSPLNSPFGDVKQFFIATDQENREQVIVDFYAKYPHPTTNVLQNGRRLLRDFDGRVVIFTRQDEIAVTTNGAEEILNLEIDKVELVHKNQGDLQVFKRIKKIRGVDVEVVDSIRFKEFSIFDLHEVELRYSFIGGTPLLQGEILNDETRKWTTSKIQLKEKVIATNRKYFEDVDFTRRDIIDGSGEDYYGRIIEDRGLNCKLKYDIKYDYEVTTNDISEYVEDRRKESKLKNPNNTDTEDNTVQEVDYKSTLDNWGRLSPDNGVIEIGELTRIGEIGKWPIAGANPINIMDKGVNELMGPDADINSTFEDMDHDGFPVLGDIRKVNNPNIWRNEAYYAPSTYKDLADLQKAAESSSVQGEQIFEITNTPAIFERQNIGNEQYIARENDSTDITIAMTQGQTAIDPLFSGADPLYDANGSNAGKFDGYRNIGESGIGSFAIGGYIDKVNGLCINSAGTLRKLETVVDADPVNLQLETYDCDTVDFEYSGKWDTDNANLKGDSRGTQEKYKTNEDGEDSFAEEEKSIDITYAPYTDDYNYEQHDYDIGELDTIGSFFIKGPKKDKLFDESEHVTATIQMNRETTLAYNDFTSMTNNIGEFIIQDPADFIGGKIKEITGTFEVYQAVWNTHEWDSDNITSFIYGYTDSDNTGKIGDFRNNGNDDNIYEQISGKRTPEGALITEEVFAAESNTTDIGIAMISDNYNYSLHDMTIGDLDDLGFFIGGTIPDDLFKESEAVVQTINANRHPSLDYAPGFDWKALYAINQRTSQLNQGDNLNSGLFIGGEVTYDFGDNIDGFADPVNIQLNTQEPSIFNIVFGNVGGENEDLLENEASLHWVGDSITGGWENYKSQKSGKAGGDNTAIWVTEKTGYEERLEASKLWSIHRDYWEIEEQNYNIGEDGVTYVGGIPKPIQEPEHTVMTYRATTGGKYRYPTYLNLAANETNVLIGQGYIGGELTHDEDVDAEVFKDIYTDAEISLDTIAPTIIEETDYRYINGNKKFIRQLVNEETGVTATVFANEPSKQLDHTLTSIVDDVEQYRYRNYGTEIGDLAIGESGKFIGGEDADVNDEDMATSLKSTTIFYRATTDQEYTYNTFDNALNGDSIIGDNAPFIGGELHTERVDADVYLAQWNTNEFDADTIDSIKDYSALSDDVDFEDKQGINEISDIGADYYNYRDYGTEIGDLAIGENGKFIGGELVDINDTIHNIGDLLLNGVTVADAQVDTYKESYGSNDNDSDSIDAINETKSFGIEEVTNGSQDSGDAINGGSKVEVVFAQEENNTLEAKKVNDDDYNLRNGDVVIGQGMLIGGDLAANDTSAAFYIGGELVKIIDETNIKTDIVMGHNSNSELIVAGSLVIGDGVIGDTYIKARLVNYTGRREESYMNVGDFDIFSDEDNFGFGVWKNDGNGNYHLLTDDNLAAI